MFLIPLQRLLRGLRRVPSAPRRFRPVLECLEVKVLPATVLWNVDSNGFWDVGSNWDTGSVPQLGDDVIIDRPAGNFTVTFRQGNATVRLLNSSEALAISGGLLAINNPSPQDPSTISSTLTLTGGTLTGTAVLNVGGLFTWNGGTQSGSGRTNANGGMQIGGAGVKFLDLRTLQHMGTATWQGTGDIAVANGSSWINPIGSTIDIRDNAALNFNFSGNTPTLRNEGTLRKSAGAGSSNLFVHLQNTGVVEAQTGMLGFGLESSTSGRIEVSSGATVYFLDGMHTATATSRVEGAGTIQVSNKSTELTVEGIYAVGGTRVTGGLARFNSAASTVGGSVEQGMLTGSAAFTITGQFTWSGGTVSGSGVTTVTTTGTLALSGAANKTLAQRTLDLLGTTRWTESGEVFLRDGAVINNQDGATFLAENNAEMSFFAGANPTFNNAGLFRKIASAGRTWFSTGVFFNNSGRVEVDTGTLSLSAGDSSGLFLVAPDAILNFTTLVHNLTETSTVTGQGTVRFTGGTTNLVGTYDVENTVMVLGIADYGPDFRVLNMTISGGTIRGSANFTITNSLTWSGGTLAGPGATYVDTTATFTLTGAAMTLAGRNIDHAGTGLWTGNGTIATTGAPVVTVFEGATFSAQGNGSFLGDGFFVNFGTFLKEVGGAATTFGAGTTFGNGNLVQVLSGRLSLLGEFPNFANQTLLSGTFFIVGTLQFVNADLLTNEAEAVVILSGPASAIVNQNNANALVNFDTNHGYFGIENSRDFTTAAAFTNSGVLAVQAPSIFTATGLFNWIGGILSGNGTLQANGGLDLDSVDAVLLHGLTVNLAMLSTWIEGDLVAGEGARINIAATATLTIPIDANAYHSGSGDPVLIVNAGTVSRTDSPNSATLWDGIGFTNNGIVLVEIGTLALLGGLTNFDPGTGVLQDGTYTLRGLLQFPGAALGNNQAIITLIGIDAGIVDENFASAFLALATNAGQLTLQGGAALTSDAPTLINSGQITLTGAGTAFATSGSVVTFTATGRLTLQSGANFSSAAATFTNNGQITLSNAGTAFAVTGALVTGGAGSALTINNGTTLSAGTFTLTSGNATVAGPGGTLTANTVTVQGGTLSAPGILTANVVLQNGTLATSGTINGGVTQTGGTWNGSGTVHGGVLLQNGTFNASGTINGDVLFLGGRVNLGGGNAVGTLRVNGDWTQQGGILQVQLRDENSYDRLIISGTATLGGTLEVRVLNSFKPPLETPFDFLTFGGFVGEFATISPPQDMVFRIDFGETGAALVREE